MEENKFFVGAYRNGCINLKSSRIRYTTYCLTLDYFCLFEGLLQVQQKTSEEALCGLFFKKTNFRKSKINQTIVTTALKEMIMLGLVNSSNDELTITDDGKRAYINQHYHIVLSNLNADKQSRMLSLIAIVIAFISLFLTIISLHR